jgi:hypothetical protein
VTDEEKVRRAQNADRLLNDDTLKEAIRAVRDKCVDDFKSAPAGDIEALRVARLTFENAERFVNALRTFVRDGQFAQMTIEATKAAEKRSRAKRPSPVR